MCNLSNQALSDCAGGNPTKSRLQHSRLARLLDICRNFGLLNDSTDGKVTKGKCVERIMGHVQHLQGLQSVSLLRFDTSSF